MNPLAATDDTDRDEQALAARAGALVNRALVASAATVALPHVASFPALLALVAVFGAVTGSAGVAMGVALAACSTSASRGLVMGGYSATLYLGLALGSFTIGPIVTQQRPRGWLRRRRSARHGGRGGRGPAVGPAAMSGGGADGLTLPFGGWFTVQP